MQIKCWGLVIGLICLIVQAGAQTAAPVLQSDTIASVEGYKRDGDRVTPVDVTDKSVPFAKALRVKSAAPSDVTYESAMLWVTKAAVKKGDLLVAHFYVRNTAPKSGPLRVDVTFQLKDEPYTPTLVASAPVDTDAWQSYAIPFRAIMDYPAGVSTFQLRYSLAAQRFEVGGVEVVNHGPVSHPIPAGLAKTFAYYYPGRGDAKAAWRVAALKRIEDSRKGDMAITVVNSKGAPMANAVVSLEQIQSPFVWGTAASAISMVCNVDTGDSARPCPDLDQVDKEPVTPNDYRRLRKELLANFNGVSFYNDLKWTEWHRERQLALDGIAWLKRNKMPLTRGHNLIWPSFTPDFLMPNDVINAKTPAAEVKRVIAAHFKDVLTTLRGQVPEWDVVNEPFTNTDVQGRLASPNVKAIKGVLPVSEVATWFSVARKHDPGALLFVNDFNILDSLNPAKLANDVALVKMVKERGAPVDGIGFQGHFGVSGPVFTDMQKAIDDFSPLVKTMSLTEFDFETLDPSLQRDVMDDVMTFIYSQPKFNLFQMWGFWDGDHWLGNGPLYHHDWALKPSGEVWKRLTQETWRTRANLAADGEGRVTLRTFYGRYKVSVLVLGGKLCVSEVSFVKAGEMVVPADC
jgi:endo-1,4-beta-xylanase